MKISCPSCEATYQLADRAIGSTGRKVRCTRCGTIWHALPDAPAPEPAFADPFESETADWRDAVENSGEAGKEEVDAWRAALNEDDAVEPSGRADEENVIPFRGANAGGGGATDEEQAFKAGGDEAPGTGGVGGGAPDGPDPSPDGGPGPTIEAEPAGFGPRLTEGPDGKIRVGARGGRRRGKAKPSRQIPSWAIASLIVAALSGVIGVGIAARDSVVAAVPDLAGLYGLIGLDINLRGLSFADVRTYRRVEDTTPVLVVEGRIENVSDRDRPVPEIRFGLRSPTGREVYAWTMSPARPEIAAGGSMTFKSKLPTPPDAAVDVQVRFADKGMP